MIKNRFSIQWYKCSHKEQDLWSVWSSISSFYEMTGRYNKKSWFDLSFIFFRLLLICQLEILDLPLTWNGFAFWKTFWITFSKQSWEQGSQRVSRLSCEKMVLHDSLSDLGQHLRDLQARFFVEYFNPKQLSLTKKNLKGSARSFWIKRISDFWQVDKFVEKIMG